jgi:hypothetical protein
MATALLYRGRLAARVQRIRAETGLTVVEVLVASVLLIIGVLGTFMMLDVSSRGAAAACSVDDGRDGYGVHAASVRWCSDSASTGTTDTQAEDLKRVTADVSYSVDTRAQAVQQTATFSASGAPVGPSVSALSITSPGTYAGQASPVVTSTPAGGILSFTATSAGAADMKFTINGAEQPGGVTSLGAGSWRLDWNISSLKDGTYTIGAAAVDALGTRGQPRTMQVALNRGVPATLSGAVGGYNYVNISGTRS